MRIISVDSIKGHELLARILINYHNSVLMTAKQLKARICKQKS